MIKAGLPATQGGREDAVESGWDFEGVLSYYKEVAEKVKKALSS